MTDFLTAAQAAQRLGVKPATLYAYVSRGVLSRDKAADGRGSLFDAEEVERLARRGRPRRPAGAADITVESAITEITGDRLHYRGHDAPRLAVSRGFEDVAELLWTGELPPERAARTGSWQATPAALAAGRAARAALPAGTLPLEQFQVIVPAMAVTDPLRLHLDPSAVSAAGRSIIAGMVDCLPVLASRAPVGPGFADPNLAGDGPAGPAPAGADRTTPAPDQPVADRLWPRLCDRRPTPALRRALSAALVLLADHELAASTLAARVAASVRADPYAVVTTGLGAMSGALHGGASLAAETCSPRPAARRTSPGWWANCCGGGSGCPGSAISCTGPAIRAPPCCSTWCGAPRRSRRSSRWPRPSWPRSGGSPCPSRTSTSPSLPWPGSRA